MQVPFFSRPPQKSPRPFCPSRPQAPGAERERLPWAAFYFELGAVAPGLTPSAPQNASARALGAPSLPARDFVRPHCCPQSVLAQVCLARRPGTETAAEAHRVARCTTAAERGPCGQGCGRSGCPAPPAPAQSRRSHGDLVGPGLFSSCRTLLESQGLPAWTPRQNRGTRKKECGPRPAR